MKIFLYIRNHRCFGYSCCTKRIDGKGKDWLGTIDQKMVGLNPRPEVNNVLQGLHVAGTIEAIKRKL